MYYVMYNKVFLKEKAMEVILMDMKRAMRSVLGMAHAVSGALRSALASGTGGSRYRRSLGDASRALDVYGRAGKADIYSGREMVEFFRATAASKDKAF
jgi:hypothetical protein